MKLFLMDTRESGEAIGVSEDPSLREAAGSVRARTLRPASVKGLVVREKDVSVAARRKGRWIDNDLASRTGAIVFSSCMWNEASLESDAWAQGAFTRAV